MDVDAQKNMVAYWHKKQAEEKVGVCPKSTLTPDVSGILGVLWVIDVVQQALLEGTTLPPTTFCCFTGHGINCVLTDWLCVAPLLALYSKLCTTGTSPSCMLRCLDLLVTVFSSFLCWLCRPWQTTSRMITRTAPGQIPKH